MIFPKARKEGASLALGPAARASVIGLHLVSGLMVGGGIGYLLAEWSGRSYVFIIFLLLGLVAGCINVVRDVKKLLREQDANDAAQHTKKH